jgi:hypothetical protein
MATFPPLPDRLGRIRRYALMRSAELAAEGRIAALLRAELPELTPEAVDAIAAHLVADLGSRVGVAIRDAFSVADVS